jgi:hypothetical protein
MVWMLYGLMNRDLLVAAPGLVTVPANFTLAAWCARRASADAEPLEVPSMVIVPDWEPVGGFRSGDTLEMPRIVA